MTTPDDEIRSHFDDLRAEDAADAPAFSTLRSNADRQATAPVSGRRPVGVAWWGAAAAAAVIVATVFVRPAERSTAPATVAITDSAEYPSIVSWTSPTAGLLRASRQIGTPPSVFGSVLDGVTAPPTSSDSSKKGGL
jgi:hypothetical protein